MRAHHRPFLWIVLTLGVANTARAADVPWLAEVTTAPKVVPSKTIGTMRPLLQYRGKRIDQLEGWPAKRKALREDWSAFLGHVAKAPPSTHEVLRTETVDGCVRQRIRYENEPGQFIEAWLLRPAGALKRGRQPGIVALHQTTRATIDEIAGVTGPEDQHIGLKLARRGFLVICPRNFLWEDAPTIGEAAQKFLARRPNTLGMSKMLYDARRAVDILVHLEEIDAERIGAIGHSLGAKETLYLTAFDDRIRAAVASEGGTTFRSTNWNAPWYLGKAIDDPKFPRNHHELLALIAPRPFLILAGESGRGAADGDRSWPLVAAAQGVYRLWDEPIRLGVLNHRQGHRIPPDVWERAVQWLETYVRDVR